jgi:hypothetical protein
MRWRLVLPVVGLIVFTAISYHSYRVSPEGQFFLWSTLRLDSDPQNRNHQSPCVESKDPCVGWDPVVVDHWARPTLVERWFARFTLPAFFVGTFIVFGLGKLGINEVLSFFVLMPLLTLAWYYFVGWLIDRWRFKRSLKA